MNLRITATVETVTKYRGLGGRPAAIIAVSIPDNKQGVDAGTLTLTLSDPALIARYEPGEQVTITLGGQ